MFFYEKYDKLFSVNEREKKITVYKKITSYKPTKLDIVGATLLSTDEAEALPLRLRQYKSWWWLRSSIPYSDLAACVNYDGSVDCFASYIDDDGSDIRPALQIKNFENSNLEIGDILKFENKEFEIISDTLAFCTTDIGKHRFDTDHNNYEKSEVKKYVDEWFEKSKE